MKTGRPSSRPPPGLPTISARGGYAAPASSTKRARVLGGFATVESIAHGFQSGLRFLSLMTLVIGLAVGIALARAAKGLRAPGIGLLVSCASLGSRRHERLGPCPLRGNDDALKARNRGWSPHLVKR